MGQIDRLLTGIIDLCEFQYLGNYHTNEKFI